jgi:dolichol-phosphate mannosyltransferase
VTDALRLSVVVLAYNEEENLSPVIAESIRVLEASPLVSEFELLVVDDGSSDGTWAVLEALAADIRIRPLRHLRNRGMGAAVKTGYRAATMDHVTFIPADGQVPIVEILKMAPDALDGADMVLGNYTQRAQVDGGARMFLSRGLRLLMAAMLGTRREMSGVVLFRRALLDRLPIKSESFFANLEFPVRAIRERLDVRDVAIEVHARRSGQSKVANLGRVRRVATELVKFRFHLLQEAIERR